MRSSRNRKRRRRMRPSRNRKRRRRMMRPRRIGRGGGG